MRDVVSGRRKRLKRAAAAVGLMVLLSAGGLAYAMLRTPGWYDPPIVPEAERQQVRNNLVAAEQAFTEGLRLGGEPFVYHIFQDDVNRWIAMRREIYPLIDQLIPTELADPFVRFDADLIAVAGRVSTPAGRVVLSIDVTPAFEDRAIVLRATAVRCGSVSMPMDFGGLDLARSIEREPEKVWPGSPRIWGDLLAGLHLDARAWWKNGGIDYRVLNVWVEPGVLHLKIEPLGPHHRTARRTHDWPF